MKMLICSIGSKKCTDTLRFGLEVARALAADTTVLGIADRKRHVPNLELLLDQVAQELVNQGLAATSRVEAGRAEDIVMDELAQTPYDLVAVGALGSRRSRRALLDSVGMQIVEQAQSSVLLIKGDRPSLSRILVCFSGTEQGHLSVETAAAMVCGAGAEATLFHVVDAPPAMYAGLELMEETLAELLQSNTDMARELKRAAETLSAECATAQIKLGRGVVADEILREGKEGDYDLIVLGSARSAGGLVRMLMGDLNRALASRSQRPVLVVRPKT